MKSDGIGWNDSSLSVRVRATHKLDALRNDAPQLTSHRFMVRDATITVLGFVTKLMIRDVRIRG